MTEFHADDYGLFVGQSRRILQCRLSGSLNGISIFPNGDDLLPCLEFLPEDGIALTVHLNLLQGRCLSPPVAVPLLVDADGLFRLHFSELLFSRFTGKYASFKKQLKMELESQIRRMLPFFEKRHQPLRIDGHAHWHMIPVVFDALMEVIEENRYQVTYIRIPAEPVGLYIRNLFKIVPLPFINIIKMLLLQILALRNRWKWKKALSGVEKKVFMGVLLSGCFDLERMAALLPSAKQYAEKCGYGLEILAHPGSVYELEAISRITNRDDLRFFTSPARDIEAYSLMHIDDNSN